MIPVVGLNEPDHCSGRERCGGGGVGVEGHLLQNLGSSSLLYIEILN